VEAVEFQRVTKITDSSWWKQWNFSGSQKLLTPVGGSGGILRGSQKLLTPVGGSGGISAGHKNY
jgi:hypothetical protein